MNSRSGWEIARFFDVPVYVTGSWVFGSALIAFVFTPLVTNQIPSLGNWAFAVGLAFAVLLGASVLVHELAHTVTALAYGMRVRSITLQLLGGVSEIEGEARRPWPDLVIAVLGPVASFALAAIGFGLVQLLTPGTVWHLVAWQIAATNLIVAVFNLLPGLPLDGGRIMRDLVWAVTGRESTGTIVAAWLGRALAVAIILAASYPSFTGSPDLIYLIWGFLLAGFIWVQAGYALRVGKVRSKLPAVSVHSLTRRAITVPGDTPVSEALRQLADAQAGGLVTLDRHQQPVGIVNEASVTALPEQRRPWIPVSSVARLLGGTSRVPVDATGEELVEILQREPAPEYLVVNADGAIFGVLAYADVERAINHLTGRSRG